MSILLAGPWVGELGWELFCWQGYIRGLSRKYDQTIIIGRPGHKFLYSDFCNQYVEFDPRSYQTNGWRCEGKECNLHKSIKHDKYISGQFDIGIFYDGKIFKDTKKLFCKQEFYKYQLNTSGKSYDIIIHARNKSTGSVRNWSFQNWEKLIKLLRKSGHKIATIGNSESYSFKKIDDYRGVTLKKVAKLIYTSKLIVGPSSGPMHLASLCGKKHLVWSTDFNRLRYEEIWNPFKTPVIFYDEGGWDPDYNKIFRLVQQNL